LTSKKKSPEEGLYSRVTRRMWLSKDFRSLSAPKPNAQTLWLRLLTGPELGQIPGLFRMTQAGLAEALGWPLFAFQRCLKEITDKGMATHDKASSLMWVPKAIHHNAPDNSNVVLGWRQAWKELPDCGLRDEASVYLYDWCNVRGDGWARAWTNVTGYVPPNPTPIGGGEQKQEQEQEQDIPPTPPQNSELAERARRWVELADAGNGMGRGEADMRYGDPARWAETLSICEAMRETFGRPDEPRYSGDPRARVVVDRFVEGFSPAELAEAIRGAKNDPNIRDNRQFQALKTILRDAAQVDKFRALATPAVVANKPEPRMRTFSEVDA
jgi:hypothetical protein